MRLRLLTIFAGFLLFGDALYAVQIGDLREAVVAEKGQPSSSIETSTKTVLYFPDGEVVTFSAGKVSQISQRPPSQDRTERPVDRGMVQSSQIGKVRTNATAVVQTNRDLCTAIGIGLLTSLLLFRVFFSHFADFVGCACFSLLPTWISLFRNARVDGKSGRIRLGLWLILSAAPAYGVYYRSWILGGH